VETTAIVSKSKSFSSSYSALKFRFPTVYTGTPGQQLLYRVSGNTGPVFSTAIVHKLI
jgi:hypothetical protein